MRILTVNDQVADYVSKITAELSKVVLKKPILQEELRFTVDDSSDSLGKKIKRATEMKIPVVIVVGPRDAESLEVSIRLRDGEKKIKLSGLKKFLEGMK